MNQFVELAAKEHGVKRFVLLGGVYELGEGRHVGKLLPAIKERRKIYTATGDYKIPFISAMDVARVAFHCLTDDKPHNTAYRVNGPEMLSYDEIAEKPTRCLRMKIEHVKLDEEARAKQAMEFGTPGEPLARFLNSLEASGAGLSGDIDIGNDVEKATGQRPQSFDSFAEEHKNIWL
ncbi:hypothetical protein V5O48_004649 [Marasmius crinis-equi]|uniref:NmrA-like domain-containing protein n=1 Tax=Marasmius crinis-equi TaxID=585013 RepID=A0ABR3FPF3_9AGAR